MSQIVLLFFSLCRSVSMGDIINEDEMGHSPSLSQSRYERMQEQYNNFVEEEEHWQDVRRLHDNFLASIYIYIFCQAFGNLYTGIDSLEESPSQRLTGTYQEGGREEEDGEKVEGGGKRQ